MPVAGTSGTNESYANFLSVFSPEFRQSLADQGENLQPQSLAIPSEFQGATPEENVRAVLSQLRVETEQDETANLELCDETKSGHPLDSPRVQVGNFVDDEVDEDDAPQFYTFRESKSSPQAAVSECAGRTEVEAAATAVAEPSRPDVPAWEMDAQSSRLPNMVEDKDVTALQQLVGDCDLPLPDEGPEPVTTTDQVAASKEAKEDTESFLGDDPDTDENAVTKFELDPSFDYDNVPLTHKYGMTADGDRPRRLEEFLADSCGPSAAKAPAAAKEPAAAWQ